MNELLVLPKARYLTGDSYVWHFHLLNAGWNELTCLDKVGVVVGVFELTSGGRVVDVYWPALDVTTINVFPSEITEERFK